MNWLFDECMPPTWSQAFADLVVRRKDNTIEACHLLDHLKSGTGDDGVLQWIQSQPRHVMLISGDNSRKTRVGDPRMHLLSVTNKVTAVFLSPKLCQYSGFEKFRALIYCLPQLEQAYDGPVGDRYRIEPHGTGYKSSPWPLPSTGAADRPGPGVSS